MPTVTRREDGLENLRRAAEAAAGSMRDVADHLSDIADNLPRLTSKAWRLDLDGNAKRLRAAADLLVAEVNIGCPSTAGSVASVARKALGAVVVVLGTGVVGGATEAAVGDALAARDRAANYVEYVEAEAATAQAQLAQAVDAELEELRRWLDTVVRHPHQSARLGRLPAGESDRVHELLAQPRMGLSSMRERLGTLYHLMRTLDVAPPVTSESADRIDALRRLVEMADPAGAVWPQAIDGGGPESEMSPQVIDGGKASSFGPDT